MTESEMLESVRVTLEKTRTGDITAAIKDAGNMAVALATYADETQGMPADKGAVYGALNELAGVAREQERAVVAGPQRDQNIWKCRLVGHIAATCVDLFSAIVHSRKKI